MLSEKEIDEIIEHAEEVAKKHEAEAKANREQLGYHDGFYNCEKCAADHRNIAEGFKELKAARRMLDALGWHYHNGCYYNDKAHKEYFGEVK